MLRIVAAAAALVLVVLLAAGIVRFWYGNENGDRFAQCRETQIASGEAEIGGPFTLVNSAGETVTDEDVIAEPSLIYFGYTYCPDVCPLDTVRNADATEILEQEGHDVTPVFITVDPKRDTPDVVGQFAANISDDMMALTGSTEQIDAATRAYRAYYRLQDAGDDPYYLVDHSTFTYLVLPEQGFVEFFRRDESPEAVAERTACFLEAS